MKLSSLVALLGLAASAALAAETAGTLEGNRLFRAGDLEAALESYLETVASGISDPLLCYNIGTTYHHLERLPQAILWYRRALDVGARDPWLMENLQLARREVGGPEPQIAGASLWLARHRDALGWSAVALAWLGIGIMILGRKASAGALAGLLAAALLLFVADTLLARYGPRPGVLLAECEDLRSHVVLPAGAEVWARQGPGAAWRILGSDGTLTCPGDRLAFVEPRG